MTHYVAPCMLTRKSDQHYWNIGIHLEARDPGIAYEQVLAIAGFVEALDLKLIVHGIIQADHYPETQLTQIYVADMPHIKFTDNTLLDGWQKFVKGSN